MSAKLPFQQSMETMCSKASWTSIVSAGVIAATSIVLVVLRFWSASGAPKVKILLQDEIKSARQRALEYCFNPRAVMARGYAKFKNEVFGLDTQDGVKLVIPPSFLDELKSHPALSFKVSIDNDMQIEYTHFGGPAEYVIHAIKANLTGSLSAFTPLLHRMVQKNMPKIIGKYKDWTPVKVHDRVLRLIATNNARVFQGTAASLDEEWLEASTGYVLACFDCIRALKQWHPWLRPLVYRFIPERSAIKDQWTKGRKRVMASMRERQEKGGNLEDPLTMLDHLSNGRNEHIADDVELQLLHQMTLIAVGTVTTFSSTTQAIYDLVAHPEYVPILREEVESVPRDQNGNFTRDSTVAMDKLDSFLKESQRFNSPDLTTFQRAAIADMTLPDGTFVPKGTKLEINTCSIHKDHELYENPEEFDGLRFHKWRKAPGKEKKYMYSSSGTDDLSWGFGRHACPGRYLSAINIKLIMAELLMNYDIKLPDGVSRPKNIEFEVLCSPEPDFEILFKDRNH
ncbi:related to cytochrome P450 monooxygenase [Fusarium proliferatum]|nr:related to cytochrome P450 monooxygenase [Fusarium proliferatum]